MQPSLGAHAMRYAALGDSARLAIVQALCSSDLTPAELRKRFGIPSNLVTYHLDVLERAGLIARCPSSGDGRRRYACLRADALPADFPSVAVPPQPALFICTLNSARSQLAAALWKEMTATPASSAGTHPAPYVHRGAVAAARRAGVDLEGARPRSLDDVGALPELVVTVCDRAHEELEGSITRLHWSVADPVEVGTAAAFDATVRRLRDRISSVTRAAA